MERERYNFFCHAGKVCILAELFTYLAHGEAVSLLWPLFPDL